MSALQGGLRSISWRGRGAAFHIPLNRRGGPRTTMGLPGTGLSWSGAHTPEAMEGHVLRAQRRDDAERRAQRCITAAQEVSRLAAGAGLVHLTLQREVP